MMVAHLNDANETKLVGMVQETAAEIQQSPNLGVDCRHAVRERCQLWEK